MADRIPAYEVENNVNKKRQVLHQTQLLLWLADQKASHLGLTGAELAMPLHRRVSLGMVQQKLIYGLNTAMFESRQELPELTTCNDA